MSNPSATRARRDRRRTARRCVWFGAVALSCPHVVTSEAFAHPFGDRFTAQRLEVEVRPETLVITLTADVPARMLEVVHPGVPHPERVALDRLDAGLTATVDGVPLVLERTAAAVRRDPVEGTDWILAATWTAAADLRGRHTIRVGNANLGDQPSWFRDEVRLPPASRLWSTSLLPTRRGREIRLHDAWARNEGLRRIDLDVEVAADAWSEAFRAREPRPWTLGEARIPPGLPAWRAGRTDPLTLAVAALVSFVAGVGAGLAAGRRAVPLVLVGALGAFALPQAASGPTALVLAVAALLVALEPAHGRFVPLLAVPWAQASVSAPHHAFPLAALVLGALAGGWRGVRRPAAAVLLVAALAAALRG